MSRMSRRAFLGFRFSEEDAGTRDVPGGAPPETSLPPEFSPAMLRASAPCMSNLAAATRSKQWMAT